MRYLLFIFIIVPALEISLLMLSGKAIGILPTFLLILATGFLGAYFAKKQGMNVVVKLREDLQNGRFIGEAVMDGVCVLVGGLLLLTPGFVTDISGFLLLLPYTRRWLQPLLLGLFRRSFQNNNIIIMK
ncbi:FxsA family protein [Bacillus badius]|uniref:FxsA protein n=1 Tax=Bacillus badius TaxID=1455 RepID=A0ABR5ASM3_BACBA|nr:FxsA family protein [Bacillus badius]KIL77752.1 FxsA protein [Bacillus badius]KZR59260.1 exlusion protein FxsA [Bacillus badius]MED4715736.1 membrane protein FxsA [Bacillus badius]